MWNESLLQHEEVIAKGVCVVWSLLLKSKALNQFVGTCGDTPNEVLKYDTVKICYSYFYNHGEKTGQFNFIITRTGLSDTGNTVHCASKLIHSKITDVSRTVCLVWEEMQVNIHYGWRWRAYRSRKRKVFFPATARWL